LPPSSVHARYVVMKGGIEIAEINEVYSRKGSNYSLISTAKALGVLALFKQEKIIIRSDGLITKQGLKPLKFGYQREGDSSKDSHADFVWNKQQLSLNSGSQKRSVNLPGGTQDRLSAMYQFMFLNLRDQHSLAFAMTNGSKLDNYHYAISAGADINTTAGRFKTLYLDSQAKAGETRTEIWLATAQRNLPCKLVITDPEGGKLTQELRKLDIQP
jgi:hypothetical protein